MKLPKSYIKKYGISKEAWKQYKASLKSSSSKARSKTVTKKNKSKKKRQFTIPLALVGGLAASVARPIMTAVDTQDYQLALWQLLEGFTGYYAGNNTFDISRLKFGLLPLVLGAGIHKFVGGSPLNVNRSLGQAGVPVIRV